MDHMVGIFFPLPFIRNHLCAERRLRGLPFTAPSRYLEAIVNPTVNALQYTDRFNLHT
jgi:hypothetical protein